MLSLFQLWGKAWWHLGRDWPFWTMLGLISVTGIAILIPFSPILIVFGLLVFPSLILLYALLRSLIAKATFITLQDQRVTFSDVFRDGKGLMRTSSYYFVLDIVPFILFGMVGFMFLLLLMPGFMDDSPPDTKIPARAVFTLMALGLLGFALLLHGLLSCLGWAGSYYLLSGQTNGIRQAFRKSFFIFKANLGTIFLALLSQVPWYAIPITILAVTILMSVLYSHLMVAPLIISLLETANL